MDMFTEAELTAFWITFKLAAVTTFILLVISTPLAWWLRSGRGRGKVLVESLVALPLILPPTVLGFYLLLALGPHGPVGKFMVAFGGQPLAFTFTGLVIGSVIYSLPFVVQPLQNSFSAIQPNLLEAASTMRASPVDAFFKVAVPMAKKGFLAASVLGFAHTVGEFGVVLMIGGNIPGRTQVVSVAIYDRVESLNYVQAHWLAGALLVISFVMLVTVYGFYRFRVVKP